MEGVRGDLSKKKSPRVGNWVVGPIFEETSVFEVWSPMLGQTTYCILVLHHQSTPPRPVYSLVVYFGSLSNQALLK